VQAARVTVKEINCFKRANLRKRVGAEHRIYRYYSVKLDRTSLRQLEVKFAWYESIIKLVLSL
jgi:hypothetical protein